MKLSLFLLGDYCIAKEHFCFGKGQKVLHVMQGNNI